MKHLRKSLGAVALVCGLMCGAPSAFAQAAPEITAQTLIDRAKIEDLVTRYLTRLGHASPAEYAAFYTEDGELINGAKHVKGRAALIDSYTALRTTAGPMRAQAYGFNTLLSNPLITVRGDTATVQLTWTEVIQDTQHSPPRMVVQGREYDELARVNGEWLFKKRQVVSGRAVPVDWRP